MSDGRDKFILYEYLMFFWRKKWVVLVLPLLGILIPIILGFVKEPPFVGNLTYYTGDIAKEELINLDLIKNDLPQSIKNKATVVKGEKTISFVSTSQNQNEIRDIFTKVDSNYGKRLESSSEDDLKIQKDYLKKLKSQSENLEVSLKNYQEKVHDPKFNIKPGDFAMIQKLEKNLYDSVHVQEDMIKNYQKPEKVSMTIGQQNKFTKSNILVGFIVGLFLSFCLVTLWKYILDAKRVY